MSPQDSVDRIQELEARLAELERLDELKSQFISLASHELRTPIAVVQGTAATLHLRGDQLAPEQRRELRQTLYLQSCRLGELTEQLLDLSRLDSDALVLSPVRFHPRERIEELLTRIAPDRLDEVELGVEPGLELYTDPNAFERVVANLLTNALHYGARPIEVRAQPARQVDFVVEDHVPGVPHEFVPLLFERFSQGTATGSADRVPASGSRLQSRSQRRSAATSATSPRSPLAPASASSSPASWRRKPPGAGGRAATPSVGAAESAPRAARSADPPRLRATAPRNEGAGL